MSKRVEAAIQKALIAWVKETYPEVIITATANERSYKEVEQIGCLGIPDLILFYPTGKVLFLELKTKTGRFSESQIEFNEMFDSRFQCFQRDVAYGFSHAKELIINWLFPS